MQPKPPSSSVWKLPFGIRPVRALQLFALACLIFLLLRTSSKATTDFHQSLEENAGKNNKKKQSSHSPALAVTTKQRLRDDEEEVHNNVDAPAHVRDSSDDEDDNNKKNPKQKQIKTKEDREAESLQKFILFSQLRRASAHFQLQRDGKARACFVSLVRHTKDGLQRFVRLTRNVRENLPLMAARYPFIAFLEDSANIEQATESINVLAGFKANHKSGGLLPLEHVFPGGIMLIKVPLSDFGSLPPFVKSEAQMHWHYGSQNYWGMSYRHMCRFFGVRVMMQEVLLRDFDFFLRLDTDSHILERPKTTALIPKLLPSLSKWSFLPATLMNNAKRWIEMAHVQEQQQKSEEEIKPNSNINNNKLLDRLGFEERVVDIDMFIDMVASNSKYSFSMLHPQTMPQFLYGLFETYDEFFKQEVQFESEQPEELQCLRVKCQQLPDHRSAANEVGAAAKRLSKSFGNAPLINGPDPFCSPRGTGLHFWDNFEITSVEMFQQISLSSASSSSTAAGESGDPMTKKKRGVTFVEEDVVDEQAAVKRLIKRKLVTADVGGAVEEKSSSFVPSLTRMHKEVLKAMNLQGAKAAKRRDDNQNGGNEKDDVEKSVIKKHNARAMAMNRFLTKVDHSGGFFYNRWGDAEVRTLTVSLFLQSTEITYANNFPYQHYHNYHCPISPRRLSFAKERREVITDSTTGDDSVDPNENVDQLIGQILVYLQDLGFSSMTRNEPKQGADEDHDGDDVRFVNQILDPSSQSSNAYFTAKALSVICGFVSSTRRQLFASVSGNCEQNANRPGKENSGLATKGHGSAKMLPAEHEHNNKYFWKFARDQRDGFLSI